MVTQLELTDDLIISDGLYSVQINNNLEEWEIEDALNILRWIQPVGGAFYGIAGLILVTGAPRSGKGIFGNVLSWKIKRYFKGIKVVRDNHPTALFGHYILFNEDVFRDDLEKMMQAGLDPEQSKKIPKVPKQGEKLNNLITDWQTEEGNAMMQKSVGLYDEYWKWMYNRNAHNIMNKTMGGLNKMWGHTETLHVGICQWTHDLDRFTCLPWATHEVRCVMSSTIPGAVEAHMYHVRYNRSTGQLVLLDKKPIRITIDGLKERPELGISHIDDEGNPHYYRYVDIYYSKSAPMIDFMKPKDKKDERIRYN